MTLGTHSRISIPSLKPPTNGDVDAPAIDYASVHGYALSDRSLAPIAPLEPRRERWLWLGVMSAIVVLYAFTLFSFWAPADGGIDQNAYLVGGKQIAAHGTTRVDPTTPYGFVGPMFVVPENGGSGFYPKYPYGLPLLFAISTWIGGASHAAIFPFAVSTVCSIAAVAGMFFLARLIGGSFAGVLCAVALATCEVMWSLANVSNSHASCLCFVVWGFVALIKWWSLRNDESSMHVLQSMSLGLCAGFLLGYACAIRYTEGLLVIPLVLVVLFKLRWTSVRSYLRNSAPIIGWLIPLVALAIFNRFTLGTWTGYDSSNESELGKAFTWTKFQDTWEQVIRTFHDQGLFFLLPVCVMGLVMLVMRNWRVGIVVLAWLIPGTALYTSYYWSPDRGVAYARFFLTFFPALLLGLAACVRYLEIGTRTSAIKMSLGVLVFIASGVATWRVVQSSEGGPGGDMSASLINQFRSRATLATVGDVVLKNVKRNSILFTDEGRGGNSPAHYLQAIGDWELYSVDAFANRGPRGAIRMGPGANANGDNPSPMQKKRVERAQEVYKGKGDKELLAEQKRITDDALKSGRHVYIVGSRASVDSAEDRYFPEKDYDIIRIQTWKDVPEPRDLDEKGVDRNAPRPRSGNGMFGVGGGPGGGRGNNRVGVNFFNGPGTTPTQWVLVEIKLRPQKKVVPSVVL